MKCGSDVSGEQGGVATAMMPAAQERDANELMLEQLRHATLGEYEIHKELGRGGMATVYLAHDIALDRKVAIKVMSPALLMMGEGMVERFKREARTAANLSHPHIIPIYGVKSTGKSLFFVMKFIPGRSLESIIHEVGPMPVGMVRAILQQVASALGYAHRHGIVHRDVKPANIMIDEEGWSVVTDFGIAKVTEHRGLTMTGIAVGTPSYMSPEQCAAKDITGKSDQYSLGVVAYEMLTGRQPFEGDSAMAIMFAHFHEQPRPLLEKRADCPSFLAAAVMRMLAKAPDERWPSMEDAIGAMGAVPLAHDDPIRIELMDIVRRGSNRVILDTLTPPPASPAPPVRTRPSAAAATTPIPPPRIAAVTVAPARSDLHVGDAMQLTATPRVVGGTAVPGKLEWLSSDSAVATVNGSGLVTAVAPGSAIVTARAGEASGTSSVTVTPVPVAEVVIEPVTGPLTVGDELALRVAVRDTHGAALTDRAVHWTSADKRVLTVSEAGRVSAVAEGAAAVTAESEGVSGSIALTVRRVPVAKVMLAPPDATLAVGESVTLEAGAKDARGAALAGREVTWRSSTPAVATVSPRGAVVAQAEGRAEIIAAVEGIEARAALTVTPAPVSTVSIAQPLPVLVGEKLQLSVALKDQRGHPLTGRSVGWTSAQPSVAVVDQRGLVTGLTPGAAKVTAECEGKSWTVSVTVQPVPVAAVVISGLPDRFEVGGEARLAATAKDSRGNTLAGRETTWSSSAPKVVAVSPTGVISAKSAGEATITARIDGKKAEARLVVIAVAPPPAPPRPAAASLDAPAADLGAATVIIPPSPAEIAAVLAAGPSAPAAPARVPAERDEPTEPLPIVPREGPPPRRPSVVAPAAPPRAGGRGKLIGALVGLAILAGASYAVLNRGGGPPAPPPAPAPGPVVPAAVAAVSITAPEAPVAVGRTVQLAALVRDAGGRELSSRSVVWSSSDPAIAEVSAIGAVTGKAPGSVIITATSEGIPATAALTVQGEAANAPAAVAAVGMTGGGRALEVGESTQLAATVKDARGKLLADRTVVWSSSDPAVALVSSTGLVGALSGGNTTISASSEGKSAQLRITVNPKKVEPPPKPEPQPAPAPVPVAVAGLTLSPEGPSLTPGQTVVLSAVVMSSDRRPLTDREVAWRSSSEKVATVSSEGVVTAEGKGSATITASSEGKSASTTVTVTPAKEPVVAVAAVVFTSASRAMKVGESFTWLAAARDARGEGLPDRAIAWSSSNPKVASVEGGVVTGIAAGSAEIRAEAEGKSARASVTVAAAAAPPPAPSPAPVPPPPSGAGTAALLPRRGVEAGGGYSCGLTASAAVCWGGAQPVLAEIAGTGGATKLSVGRSHACALTEGGRAVCWGENRAGQLGDGSATTRAEAAPVAGTLSFTAISAGTAHSCGIAGGKAWCWGRNKEGQLGDGSTTDRRKPAQVKGVSGLVAISAGGSHTCALTAGGKAYCWGDGFSGQLGFGGQDLQAEPVDVSGDHKFTGIAAGGKHTCALTVAGKAWCWGNNENGQLGDGSSGDQPKPTAVSSGASFTEIALGENHSCGVTGGGEAWCWGSNKAGQLGDGSRSDRSKPVAVGGGPFASISAGDGHSCAMTRAGEAVCWGRNDKGQLGDGSTTPSPTPRPVRGS